MNQARSKDAQRDPGRAGEGAEDRAGASRASHVREQARDERARDDATGLTSRAPRRASAVPGHDSAPRLPHEIDESHDSQTSAPRDVLKQAHEDIEQGQQDTDRRATRGYEKPENRRRH
jgi:hypothetical protein